MNRRRMSRRKSRPWLSSTLMDFKQEVKEMKAKATQAQEREKVAERIVTLDDVKGKCIHIHIQSYPRTQALLISSSKGRVQG